MNVQIIFNALVSAEDASSTEVMFHTGLMVRKFLFWPYCAHSYKKKKTEELTSKVIGLKYATVH